MTSKSIATVMLLLLAAASSTVHAGPYCGSDGAFAPAESATLPLAPTLAFNVEDKYYDGKRRSKASVTAIRATIDGKTVAISTRDVRAVDGVIRFIKIQSRKAGKLELWVWNRYSQGSELAGSYTIAKDWTPPASATVKVRRDRDTRLGPYRRIGELAALSVDIPAIAFTLRWRRDHDDAWRVRPLPAAIENDRSEARLGQTMCGMVENIPFEFLERGIEVELTAKLPDGRELAVTDGLPNPLVIPPLAADAPPAP